MCCATLVLLLQPLVQAVLSMVFCTLYQECYTVVPNGLNPPKSAGIQVLDMISRIFKNKFQKTRLISDFSHCMPLIFEGIRGDAMLNCCKPKKNQSISRISQVLFLAGFSYQAQLCAGAGQLEPSGKGKGCKQIAHCLWPKAALSNDLSVFEFLAFQVIFLY